MLLKAEEVVVDSEVSEAGLALLGLHQDQVLDLISEHHHHHQEDLGHQVQAQKNTIIMNLNTALLTGKGNPILLLIIGMNIILQGIRCF